jgi:hypothetical protein
MGKLKQDLKDILNEYPIGEAPKHQVRGKWSIVIKGIAPEFHPLSATRISSVIFVAAPAHRNEQAKFVEDLRQGCSNLVKHTSNQPDSACPVLFVRLGANASLSNCVQWARDYFIEYPRERVGLIILYQAAVVVSDGSTSITHYLSLIPGPQFAVWRHPPHKPVRQLPNLSVLIGVVLREPSRKVIQIEGGQIPLNDSYVYQRGEIYRFYRFDGSGAQGQLATPTPEIKIYAEVGDDRGSTILKMISPETGELYLLP